MNMDRINKLSWTLTFGSLIVISGKQEKIECASSGKLREIFEKTNLSNFRREILNVTRNYRPSGTRNDPIRREKVIHFGEELIKAIDINQLSQNETKKLMQYIMWNIDFINNRVKFKQNKENINISEINKYAFIGMINNALCAEGNSNLTGDLGNKWDKLISGIKRRRSSGYDRNFHRREGGRR